MNNYELIFILLLGIILCVSGYRLKKIAFFIAWFLVGYAITTQIMPWIISNSDFVANSELWQKLFPVIGGLLLSLVGFSIEKLCLSLLCIAVAIWIGINNFGNDIPVLAVSAIIGVIAGAVSVRLMKPATIIITALAGAAIATNAFIGLAPEIPVESYKILVIAGVTIIGSIVQFISNRGLD